MISLQCVGFSCGAQALGMGASVVMMHGLTCSKAGGIFLDQRLKLCPLHWQMDSLSTVPPGKSDFSFFNIEFQVSFLTLLFHPQEYLEFLFTFCHSNGIICISEVVDISPGILDFSCDSSSLAFHIVYSAHKLN